MKQQFTHLLPRDMLMLKYMLLKYWISTAVMTCSVTYVVTTCAYFHAGDTRCCRQSLFGDQLVEFQYICLCAHCDGTSHRQLESTAAVGLGPADCSEGHSYNTDWAQRAVDDSLSYDYVRNDVVYPPLCQRYPAVRASE